MGNIHHFTVQCVLVINLFNEKIFVFLWFWFIILTALTLFSFVYWLLQVALPYSAKGFITRHMELSEMPFDPDGKAQQSLFSYLFASFRVTRRGRSFREHVP